MTVPPGDAPGGESGGEPRGGGRSGEPTDGEVDAIFAAMTASWERPDSRDDTGSGDSGPVVVDAEVLSVRQDPPGHGRVDPRGDQTVDGDAGDDPDEGHYTPPEPPPVPALTPPAMGSLALIALGLLLVLFPGLIGLSGTVGFPLGLIVISGGLTWLLSRLRTARPPRSGWDDGAQI